ncbi:MAG TPA: hypothetical protein VHS33_06480 [Sphingomicrobium sp.]|jgi:hypothetical protein|nr:hypothetical protein [Sphingomicrobium sp.]
MGDTAESDWKRIAGRVAVLLRQANGRSDDPEAAAKLLGYAAAYLAAREPMPDALADYVASAFEAAATATKAPDGVPIEHRRIDALLRGLRLKRSNNRPAHVAPRFELAMLIHEAGDVSETKLKRIVAERFGVGESTALSWIKEVKPKVAEARRLFAAEKPSADVP